MIDLRAALATTSLLAGTTAAAQPGGAADLAHIVDLRDLAHALPPDGDLTVQGVVVRLSAAANMDAQYIAPGVYAMHGSEDNLSEMLARVAEVHALYQQRYVLEVACSPRSNTDLPDVGDEVVFDEPEIYMEQVLTRRERTELAAVTTHTYVAGLVVVTGDNAIGYQPETAVVNDGLTLAVLVGAGREDAGSTPVEISGELVDVSIDRDAMRVRGRPDPPPGLDAPAVTRRTIRSALRLEFGRPTVLAIVPGFSPGKSVVVTVSVRKVE